MAELTKSSPNNTATDQTIQHYQNPRVQQTIHRFVEEEYGWRAFNGDQGWYKTKGNGKVRLRSWDDYEDTISRHRSLYATLDLLDPSVKRISKQWDKSKKAPFEPIGTFEDCLAYTLGVDIDSVAPDGLDILSSPEIKLAVEDAARHLVSRLKEAGICKSVHCLYSGGGIYALIHHELFRAKPDWTSDDRQQGFQSLTSAFNMWLADVENDFFKLHPEHKGKVKIDKINNQKRKFKCIFSIHKKHDLAVIPLDPENINIDFEKAQLPLSDEILAQGKKWYQEFDVKEKEALVTLIGPFAELVNEDLQCRKQISGNYDISHRSEPLPIESWPPCMKNILEKSEVGRGPHRACAVLAAYLYQAGWSEEEAWMLWFKVADRCGVEVRIFEQWFGKMICPNCSRIQETAVGYPKVGLRGLGYCEPDERCKGCKWPGGYNRWSTEELKKLIEEDRNRLKNPEILHALANLKQSKQLEFTLLLKDLKITGEVKKALEREINKIFVDNQKHEASPQIKAKAVEILEKGDPMQFIADGCGRMVLGAEKAFRKLICCVSVQNIQQSAGLHPKLSGESGGGKTWAVLTFAHHLPEEAVKVGSMSAKAGYYHKDGNRILRILDDYQAGNEDLDTVIKQTSSAFHEPYTHRTVANSKALTLQIGSEQTWAITSVDSSQDIQVLNRQIPINVDDSEELTKRVNRHTIERYGKGEQQFPVDETIQVCREIFHILREEGYIKVKVPYYDRIDWIDTSNRRNTSIFMDMLIAHTAMNRFQREKDQNDCYLATEGDFHAAKALFVERDAEELVHRLSSREREFAELLMRHRGGMTREEVAQAMNLSPSRISHLANGEKGDGGLSQKLPGFSAQKITDTTQLPDGDKRSTGKMLYKLQGYNPLEGFDAVVKLRDSAASADGVRSKVRPESSAEINNSKREEIEIDIESAESAARERGHLQSPWQSPDGKNLLSRGNEKNPHSDSKTLAMGHLDDRTARRTNLHSPHSGAADSVALPLEQNPERGIKAELQLANEKEKERKEHFRTPDSKKATCPICGEDIGPGHSSQIFEGISYCITCATPLSMVRASVKALGRKTGAGATTSEIFEDLARRSSRPPKREHIPAMLRAVGAVEKDGKWILPYVQEEGQPLGERQGTIKEVAKNDHAITNGDDDGALLEKLKYQVAQLEAEGKSIIPTVMAHEFGCEDNIMWLANQLRIMGFEQTKEVDPVSHMCIWKKK